MPALTKVSASFWGFLFVMSFSSNFARGDGRLSFERTEEGVLVKEAGQDVLFYQKKPKSQEGRYLRANYLHPVHDLKGEVITEDFPADHRHHRGIFWAWHQLWVDGKQLGDAWTTQDFLAKVNDVEIHKPDNAETLKLLANVHWTSNLLKDNRGEAAPVVEEQTTITVYPRESTYRMLDFSIRLKALMPGVKIGGSEDAKGYGGFSVRVKLTPETNFQGTNGPVEPKTGAVKAGPWIDFSTKQTGVAILDHPENPGYPQGWILRREKSMQNPAYPGREPVAIPQDKPMHLRYRVIIHDGSLGKAELDQMQKDLGQNFSDRP